MPESYSYMLWRKFADEDREYLAEKYELYRNQLIATGQTQALRIVEAQWEKAYGYTGTMAGVINDLQENQ